VSGSLEGSSWNLGRRYIIVRLQVSLSTSGKLVHQMWERWVRGVQFEDLTREGHTPKPLPLPLPSQDILMSAGASHNIAGRQGHWLHGAKPFLRSREKVHYRVHKSPPLKTTAILTLLERQFLWCTNFTVIRMKAVWAPEEKGKPAIKFYSSHFHIIYYKY
jgi:hypothetical protein